MNQIDIFDNKNLCIQVKELIIDYIRKNDYEQHSRLPSNRKFAELAKVSAPTVQNAVASLVQEGVLYTRRGKGTFIRRIPGIADFAPQRTGIYACVVPTILHNTVAATVYALDDIIFSKSQHHMLLMNSQNDLEREVQLLESVLDRVVDTLIYQPNPHILWRPMFARAINTRLQKFLSAGIPVIMLDRFPQQRYDTIVPDERKSCELALGHLLESGHRRILFVAQQDAFRPKINAFEEVCKEIDLSGRQIRRVMVKGEDPLVDSGKALSEVYEEGWPFTAIIACSDHYAIGCYNFLKSEGIKCPDDVSIVGADNLEYIEHLELELTTVWCEPTEVARKVCERIEYRLQNSNLQDDRGEEIDISPKLVLRKSTGPPLLKFGKSQ